MSQMSLTPTATQAPNLALLFLQRVEASADREAHPRFHIHFTPTGSSWLNLVERWFAEITVKLIRRGVHHSVKQLAADITAWADHWNANPKPYVWTKTADDILESLAAYCQRINDSRY